ncbi:3-ketoacyl-ACP reductase FabG2 [Niveibacterium sp. SC-1]|uniref:3-ketoacyl-ACP reductase FabG2 n=1 Tax=Niveibacterium sp. SC-1 TaxID=3135646 RepID=UPI0031203D64
MNQRVLVTGSSRGIGRAIALRVARDGFEVTVHCRSQREQAEAVVAEILAQGGRARALQFDVADRAGARAALEADVEAHGAYWGVVLNAGVTRDVAFPAMQDEEWDSVLRTNLDGFYNVLHPLVMPMLQLREGGRVVVMASVSGVIGNRGQVNYSASKAGLIGASKALALELAKRRVTVNCVAPGLIETELSADVNTEQVIELIPLKRAGKGSEVAGAVAFLLGEDAAYITRQTLVVDGGLAG